MQSQKFRPFVDPENLCLQENQISHILWKIAKIKGKNTRAFTAHHMLFARKVRNSWLLLI